MMERPYVNIVKVLIILAFAFMFTYPFITNSKNGVLCEHHKNK